MSSYSTKPPQKDYMRKHNKYTKEFLEPIVKSSKTYAECLRKLGIAPVGGNYGLLKKNIEKFEIDTSHMLHKLIFTGTEIKQLDELRKPESIKKRIVSERGHVCESCLLYLWMGKQISLELEHIDGNRQNNARENLKLLCPNCHSMTPTWRRKKSSLS